MKTKLIYISNTRLPSEKANSYQTMQMCNSFSKVYDEVELWTGKSNNTKELKLIKNVYGFYNIQETFKIRKFFQFDSKILFAINEFIWANLKNVIFSFNVCFRLIKYRNSNSIILYSRDWCFLLVYLFFKKIKLVNNKIFYESHKFYSFLSKPLAEIDGVIVINNYLYLLHKDLKLKSLFSAHDGVNLEEYKLIQGYDFQPNKKVHRVVYTGSLFRWKGVYTLVDSLKFLSTNTVLIFVGGSQQYLRDFENYVKDSGYASRIKIVPHLPKKELLKYIEISDVLVLPNSAKDKMSLYTSPIKLFEYMASKRPIVAANIDSVEEVLINNKDAYLFIADDPKDLAIQINKALMNDCSDMVDSAAKKSRLYSWDKRAKDISEAIK
jgi:glycosyltransferase involved in cell wall biosynthesis